MAKKPRRTKPAGHASDSTVRPTSDSTVRPALDSAATRRSNRSKLKEEALHVQPEPEKAADPLQAPQKLQTGRRGGSDPASPSPYRNPHFRPIPNIPHVPKQDPEAAEVAEGLEGLGDEGDGFSSFLLINLKSPQALRRSKGGCWAFLLSLKPRAFGPNALHKAYSKGPGEALKDAGAPSSSKSNRMRAERAMRLEARQARAAELAEEHAEWRRQTKGKGKETEVEADDEAEEEEFDEAHTKPLVSRLTKSQTECVKQQAEEERERYAALWDSTKWRKMDAAQKAKEGKNRAKMNKALWDTGGKSSAVVNVVSSDLEDTLPSFREASDDGSGAEIAPQRSSKTKL
ncbi:hypothetical protein BS47DRAFT_1368985, partial [Hydnum rufescens UP504]